MAAVIAKLSRKHARKSRRKQMKAQHLVYKDAEIRCVNTATKYVLVCNGGLGTNCSQEELLEFFLPFGAVEAVIMVQGRPYSFVQFSSTSSAVAAMDEVNGLLSLPSDPHRPLYLAFTERIPNYDDPWTDRKLPNGLIFVEDFISKSEETDLLSIVDNVTQEELSGQSLKHRFVVHYGYEFRYDSATVDKDNPLPRGIPRECNPIIDRLLALGYIDEAPDQLTINKYLPGQGIPPHVDTHSSFNGPIVSLSLGSQYVMDFRDPDGCQIPLLLTQRSVLVMKSEARYLWSHGITPRKSDVIPSASGGLTLSCRGTRVSFTFRRVKRDGPCCCSFPSQCDSQQEQNSAERNQDEINLDLDERVAKHLEDIYVRQVYEGIANHFSDTRHKPWPEVEKFVKSLPVGAILLDAGCGNGKYLGITKDIFGTGCDTSMGLINICHQRGFQVFSGDCLEIPVRSEVADACLSIAVIHHLATETRRCRAIEEMVRVLRLGGHALIYVWAKEQELKEQMSSYLKQSRKNRRANRTRRRQTSLLLEKCLSCVSAPVLSHAQDEEQDEKFEVGQEASELLANVEFEEDSPENPSLEGIQLPVHTNRTDFDHKDILVPWKLKPCNEPASSQQETHEMQVYHRFYHVFEEGELEALCKRAVESKVIIQKSYYDQGNWCVLLEKVAN